MLKAIIRHLKSDERGISTVIVVMLSLILIVVIVSNVVLWSYQMNQFDWERMQEKIEIISVESDSFAWYYQNFNYRVQHNITGSTAGSVTDYQVKITIINGTGSSNGNTYYTTHISQSDFDDVRFTWYNSSSGMEQPISYWRESEYDGINATFWIKVPKIPANPNSATIYIYYGNSTATTLSNPKQTMFIYDDMKTPPDGILDGSAHYDSANKWVRLTQPAKNKLGHLYYLKNPGNGFVAKFEFWTGGGSGADAVWLGVYDKSVSSTREDIVDGGYHFTFDEYQDRIAFTKSTVDNGAPIAYAEESSIDNSQWHKVEIIHYGRTAEIFYDGLLKLNASDSVNIDKSGNYFSIGGRTGGLTNEHRVRNLVVRKYVHPEPSHGGWGTEETYSESGGNANKLTLKLKNSCPLTVHIVSLWVIDNSLHKRYNVNIFVGSGETKSFSCQNVTLPKDGYIVKIVTDRGNIAVYLKD